MHQGKIVKYTASAGSGKTHTLTGEYLLRLFDDSLSYRRILAVTFTNKAAAEMKGRILDELSAIAAGGKTALLTKITHQLNLDSDRVQHMAGNILSLILSDYSRFSVGTIDSFFQRVFRAFTREIGLQYKYNIYLDYSLLLQDAVDDLIHNLHEKEDLRRWLVRYAGSLFEEGKPIDLHRKIYELSRTIFSEDYKLMPPVLRDRLSDMQATEAFVDDLEELTGSFRKKLLALALKGVNILDRNGVDNTDFSGKNRDGTGKYLRLLATGEIKEPYKRVVDSLEKNKWYPSGVKQGGTVDSALADGLADVVREIIELFAVQYPYYRTARVVLSNIYIAVILSDVIQVLRKRTAAENSFILADTGDLLMQITCSDQIPFIYEKVGNEYDVYMIDEFQDTSQIQYSNFKPLIENSLAQGSDTMVVGDIKQAIYRWRNGEWSILGRQLDDDFSEGRVMPKVLDVNWRSKPAIVRFNNTVFSTLPKILDSDFDGMQKTFFFSDVYRDVNQKTPEGKDGGYVRIEFVSSDDEGKASDKVYGKLPELIMQCQDDGFNASDIGILVRTKDEGSSVLDYLTRFKNSGAMADSGDYNFNMVSGESLLVGNSPSVRFLVAVMIRITDPGNTLNRTEMLRYYTQARSELRSRELLFHVNTLDKEEISIYPEGYAGFINSNQSKPLFSITEAVIDFFDLNCGEAEIACLNFFQDQVLDFMNKKGSSIPLFTEWWLKQGCKKGVILSGEQNAINIMTVHKAKGLQFKIVIIPFISWNFDQQAGNLLWVHPAEKPFSDGGAFPVGYSSAMENSFFEGDYQKEKASSYLDNLNIMYVAFTRASERLYGFAFGRSKSHAGVLLKRAVTYDDNTVVENAGITPISHESGYTISLKESYRDDVAIFETGTRVQASAIKRSEKMMVASYRVFDSSEKLRLRLYGHNLLRDSGAELNTRVSYGTVLHEIFSNIISKDDVKKAVQSAAVSGIIQPGMSEDIEKLVTGIISHDDVRQWFDGKAVVLTEPEILTGKGDIRRPDRIVIRDGKATVIDLKFGEERREHIKQIDNYRGLLIDMGYVVEEAVLWYVTHNKLVKV